MSEKSKKTFWPYGIILSLIAIAIACTATVIISLDYPVHTDDFYLEKYQDVDRNFNEIQLAQKSFDEHFSVMLSNDSFDSKSDINLTLEILPKSPEFAKNLDTLTAQILITRPETSEYDKRPNARVQSDGSRASVAIEPFSVEKIGRWQIKAKISENNASIGFFNFEILAR